MDKLSYILSEVKSGMRNQKAHGYGVVAKLASGLERQTLRCGLDPLLDDLRPFHGTLNINIINSLGKSWEHVYGSH